MATYQYELLKCEGCGKTLGYIYISAKRAFLRPFATRYLWLPEPSPEIEKTALCESCFQGRQEEISKGKQEPRITKEKSVESRGKSRDRPLIR